jgi:hypothetical protein
MGYVKHINQKEKAMKYPKSVAAARDYENSSLALGDALALECKNDRSVAEAHAEMIEQGITTLSYSRCKELRVVGDKFTPTARRRLNSKVEEGEISARVYEAAPSVEKLEDIIDRAPAGQKITEKYVRSKLLPSRGQSSPRQTPQMVRELEIQQMAEAIMRDVRDLALVIDSEDGLDQTLVDLVVDRMLTVAKEARAIADGIRKTTSNKRSHLAVVA